jgi:hypothetical protein
MTEKPDNNDNNNNTTSHGSVSAELWLDQIRTIINEPISLQVKNNIPEPPVEVLPWLYLGPRRCLNDLSSLQNEHGITHVLSLNVMQPECVVQEL